MRRTRRWLALALVVSMGVSIAPSRSPADEPEPPLPAWVTPARGGMLFTLAGATFAPAEPPTVANPFADPGFAAAQSVVADAAFRVETPARPADNPFAVLLRNEGTFRMDATPMLPWGGLDVTPADLAKRYGAPTLVGTFSTPATDASKPSPPSTVSWWGPICVIAASETDRIDGVGGWPTRLLHDRPPTPLAGLPAFTWRMANGACEVAIVNSGKVGVRVGLRSGGRGMDFDVAGEAQVTAHLPPGTVEVALVFADEPAARYRGDPLALEVKARGFGLAATKTTLTLVRASTGTYRITKEP